MDHRRREHPRLDRTKLWRQAGLLGLAAALVLSLSMIAVGVMRVSHPGVDALTAPSSDATVEPSATGSPEGRRRPADDAFVDIETGHVTPLPSSLAALTAHSVESASYDVSPDGSMLALKGDGIYVANIDGTNVRKVAEYGGAGPQWSPDSTKIVYADTSDLIIVDVASGKTTAIARLHDMVGSLAPTFGADGNSIIYTSYSGLERGRRELRTIPVTGGPTSLLRRNAESGEVSPDGTHLVYWRTGRSFSGSTVVYGLEVVDLTDGSVVEPKGGAAYSGCMGLLCEEDRSVPEWSPNGRRIVFSREGSTFVMDVTGDIFEIPSGKDPSWVDNHTLIMESYRVTGSITPSNQPQLMIVPPANVEPSQPLSGTLVVSFHRENGADTSSWSGKDVNLYADGRVIWKSTDCDQHYDGCVSEEGEDSTFQTGWVEQRLAPSGVALVRSRLLSTGLFGHDVGIDSNGTGLPDWMSVRIRKGNHFVEARADYQTLYSVPPKQVVLRFKQVQRILEDLSASMPATAWADDRIRTYIPSSYAVWFFPGTSEAKLLPASAKAMLNLAHPCTSLPSGAARDFVHELRSVGNVSRMEMDSIHFDLLPGEKGRHEIYVEPQLPDGAEC